MFVGVCCVVEMVTPQCQWCPVTPECTAVSSQAAAQWWRCTVQTTGGVQVVNSTPVETGPVGSVRSEHSEREVYCDSTAVLCHSEPRAQSVRGGC